jgi:hypothetical protein
MNLSEQVSELQKTIEQLSQRVQIAEDTVYLGSLLRTRDSRIFCVAIETEIPAFKHIVTAFMPTVFDQDILAPLHALKRQVLAELSDTDVMEELNVELDAAFERMSVTSSSSSKSACRSDFPQKSLILSNLAVPVTSALLVMPNHPEFPKNPQTFFRAVQVIHGARLLLTKLARMSPEIQPAAVLVGAGQWDSLQEVQTVQPVVSAVLDMIFEIFGSTIRVQKHGNDEQQAETPFTSRRLQCGDAKNCTIDRTLVIEDKQIILGGCEVKVTDADTHRATFHQSMWYLKAFCNMEHIPEKPKVVITTNMFVWTFNISYSTRQPSKSFHVATQSCKDPVEIASMLWMISIIAKGEE